MSNKKIMGLNYVAADALQKAIGWVSGNRAKILFLFKDRHLSATTLPYQQ